jgi:glycosyltransferase involved in cell wall biosynthesis
MAISNIVVQDLLDRVVANPTASYAWRKLGQLCNRVEDEVLRESVLQQILSQVPSEGISGFLRATFLYTFTRQNPYIADASRIVQEIIPFNVDRLVTFLVYVWWKFALFGSTNRLEFLTRLRIAAVPEILTVLGRHLETHIILRPAQRKISEVQKVAILAPLLSTIEHGPTSLAIHHAQILAENGVSVKIFATQELQVPEMEHFLGGGEDIQGQSPPNPDNWKQFPLKGFDYTFCMNQFSLMTRYKEILKLISEFDPDLILFVGFFSPLLIPLFSNRPLLGLSVHSLPPIGPIDVWLAADQPRAVPDYPWSPRFAAPQAFYYPYRIKLKPGDTLITRQELGLGTDSVVLLSVGYNLLETFRPDWTASMISLLNSNKTVQWLLVGVTRKLPASLNRFGSSQIRVLGHHPNLRGICRCCDIYVNPPQMGGGSSVATAMAEGLPVVAYAGSDGGDKVAAAAVSDSKAYFAKLTHLVNDPATRKREGEALRDIFLHTLDLGLGAPSLMNACKLTVESYNMRITRKIS